MISVAFLGRPDSPVLEVLDSRLTNLRIVEADAALGEVAAVAATADWVVVHGYRRILPASFVTARIGRIVNCHVSLLPWNRGADPNLWSVLEDTPSGITIHLVDAGVDTGPIVAQREVRIDAYDTLSSSYQRLQQSMGALFEDSWPALVSGATTPRPQGAGATSHRISDRWAVQALLDGGWEIPTARLRGLLPRHPGAPHATGDGTVSPPGAGPRA